MVVVHVLRACLEAGSFPPESPICLCPLKLMLPTQSVRPTPSKLYFWRVTDLRLSTSKMVVRGSGALILAASLLVAFWDRAERSHPPQCAKARVHLQERCPPGFRKLLPPLLWLQPFCFYRGCFHPLCCLSLCFTSRATTNQNAAKAHMPGDKETGTENREALTDFCPCQWW